MRKAPRGVWKETIDVIGSGSDGSRRGDGPAAPHGGACAGSDAAQRIPRAAGRGLGRDGRRHPFVPGSRSEPQGSTPIGGVMTSEVYTIPQYNDIHHTARLMRNHKIHHVVTQEKKVVGVLSSFDLLKLVEQHRFVMKAGPTPSRREARRQ